MCKVEPVAGSSSSTRQFARLGSAGSRSRLLSRSRQTLPDTVENCAKPTGAAATVTAPATAKVWGLLAVVREKPGGSSIRTAVDPTGTATE